MVQDFKQVGSPPTNVADITSSAWYSWFTSVFNLLKDQKKITSNKPLTFNIVSDTQLDITYVGSDGVSRSTSLTLS